MINNLVQAGGEEVVIFDTPLFNLPGLHKCQSTKAVLLLPLVVEAPIS